MFTLPAVVASIALKESADAFEAHWSRKSLRTPRGRRGSSLLVNLLVLFVQRR